MSEANGDSLDSLVGLSGFRCIVADPPWPYRADCPFGSSPEYRPNSWDRPTSAPSARARYNLMPMVEIKALPIPADDNAHLYLWTTNAFMREAHEVAEAWGFKPKTIVTWVKTKVADRASVSMKMGYYFRGATEHCLFAVRGKMRLNLRNLPTAFLWPRIGQHSRKPDAFFDMVETATPGPRLELFARRPREGWTVWGNEVEANSVIDRLRPPNTT